MIRYRLSPPAAIRRLLAFLRRCRDTVWYRRHARRCGWREAWVRAGWWS